MHRVAPSCQTVASHHSHGLHTGAAHTSPPDSSRYLHVCAVSALRVVTCVGPCSHHTVTIQWSSLTTWSPRCVPASSTHPTPHPHRSSLLHLDTRVTWFMCAAVSVFLCVVFFTVALRIVVHTPHTPVHRWQPLAGRGSVETSLTRRSPPLPHAVSVTRYHL